MVGFLSIVLHFVLVMHLVSCHHLHFIRMSFKNLHPFVFRRFSPLSVLSPTTLARARGMFEIVFYKWLENVLGMGGKLVCGVVMLLVGRLPSFVAFGARLIAQPLNI